MRWPVPEIRWRRALPELIQQLDPSLTMPPSPSLIVLDKMLSSDLRTVISKPQSFEALAGISAGLIAPASRVNHEYPLRAKR